MRLLERSLHRNAQLYLAVVSEKNTTWTTIAVEVVTFQEHLYLFFHCSELNKILDINTHNGSYCMTTGECVNVNRADILAEGSLAYRIILQAARVSVEGLQVHLVHVRFN